MGEKKNQNQPDKKPGSDVGIVDLVLGTTLTDYGTVILFSAFR